MACSKMAIGGAVPVRVDGCSNGGGEASTKRPRGRQANIGHFHDNARPTHFAKVIMSPGLDMLPIPDGFRPYVSTVPRTITLKTSTGCSWKVKVKDVRGRVTLDQGWPGFAIAHQLKIGFFLTFKVQPGDIYKVTVFDYSMTEVVAKCPQHDPALALVDE